MAGSMNAHEELRHLLMDVASEHPHANPQELAGRQVAALLDWLDDRGVIWNTEQQVLFEDVPTGQYL